MKKLISVLLIFVMLLSMAPMSISFANAATNTEEFAGGSGTAKDPYLISTKTHLNNVRNYWSAHFKMIADIEFTDADFAEGGDFYNDGQGWSPIGTYNTPFTGSFDGDGHAIKNLYTNINTSSSSDVYAGLFGYNKGTIKNLGLEDEDVSASAFFNSYAGGIAGYNNEGTITNCYSTGTISADSYIGGIVGYNDYGAIQNCHIKGAIAVSSYSEFGGIAGYNDHGTIENCYNTSDISTDDDAGGIVGHNDYGTIKNCYNIGTISVSSSSYYVDVGGIARYNDHGTIENCNNLGEIIASIQAPSPSISLGGLAGANSGIITECYNTAKISTIAPSTQSKITNVVSTGGIAGSNSSTIINSYNTGDISITTNSKYLLLEAGGIAGSTSGTIELCYNSGDVSSINSNSMAGGIAGYNEETISNCYNTGEVVANSTMSSQSAYAGGIVGENYNTITRCFSIGAVSSASTSNSSSYGGIAGYNNTNYSEGKISYCYYLETMSNGIGCNESIEDLTIQCSAVQLVQQSTFIGFDFQTIWCIIVEHGCSYPQFIFRVKHSYDNKCDPICDICGNIRTVAHTYENSCDSSCDCGYVREIVHNHNPEFDTSNHFDKCTVCGDVINVKKHEFANACDTTCDCGYERTITHDYQDTYNAASHFEECTICGNIGFGEPHAFDDDCDANCDCGYVRKITHSYGQYVYNNDATTKKDGTKTRTCSVCGNKQTVTATGTKLQSTNPFTDVRKSDFYYTPVLWAVQNGITSGASKTTFAPNAACTRGQIATFLWRAAGQPTPKTSKNPFTDVKTSDYYYKAVLWAVGKGITSGTSKTTFSPNAPCTRGQIAAFLWRANGTPKPKTSKNPFTDVKKNDFYYKAVLWAVENGITSGTTKTTFGPSEPCTRGQIATFLYRNYN